MAHETKRPPIVTTPEPEASRAPDTAHFVQLRREIDRLFEDFGRDLARLARQPPTRAAQMPAVDVVETADAWIIALSLPGVGAAAVAVTISDDILTIRGETGSTAAADDATAPVDARNRTAFERVLRLPADIDRDAVVADLAAGTLTVAIPKHGRPRPAPGSIVVTIA